jgi:anthranilate phosphoribosyltransferase
LIGPEDFGIEKTSPKEIQGGNAEYNAKILVGILEGKIKGPVREISILNAAAGIYIGGRARSLLEVIELAEESIDSRKAYEKLRALVKESGGEFKF